MKKNTIIGISVGVLGTLIALGGGVIALICKDKKYISQEEINEWLEILEPIEES